jgi:hypothetical protein
MHILIDTNIVIALEPASPDFMQPRTAVAAELDRVVTEGGNRLLLHPESLRELAGDRDPARRNFHAETPLARTPSWVRALLPKRSDAPNDVDVEPERPFDVLTL